MSNKPKQICAKQKPKCAIYQNTFAHNTIASVQNYEQYFVQNIPIICATQNNTLCNKDSNNSVQNFVQCCAIFEKQICANFFDYIVVQKIVQYFVNKSVILQCWQNKILLHSVAYIAQFCKQYWNNSVCRCCSSLKT